MTDTHNCYCNGEPFLPMTPETISQFKKAIHDHLEKKRLEEKTDTR